LEIFANLVYAFLTWFDTYSAAILYALGIPSIILSCIFATLFVAGADIRLKPELTLVKRKFELNIRTALIIFFTTFTVWIFRIAYSFMISFLWGPGTAGIDTLTWIMYFIFPVVFGVPGIWGIFLGSILINLSLGLPGILGSIANLTCGWIFWRTYGQDTSLKTKRSWCNFLFSVFIVYFLWYNLHWSTTVILSGIMPKGFYADLILSNIFQMVPWILFYPAVVYMLENMAKKHELHWTNFENKQSCLDKRKINNLNLKSH